MNAEKNEAGNSLPMEFNFNSNNQTIRVEMVNNQPFFIAKDVCVGLNIAETDVALRKLDDDEKLMRKIYGSGQHRDMWLVNESGLYNLIFRSNKPEAKAFRKWVTQDVLPAIRKTGQYNKPATTPLLPAAPRKHNRLTQQRIVDILADVAKIENTVLRLQLVAKIMGT